MSRPIGRRGMSATTADSLQRLLRLCVNQLREPAMKSGRWKDVRGTSDALLALAVCLPDRSFKALRSKASMWLIDEGVAAGSGELTWSEEVWDTSVALIGLSTEGAGNLHGIADVRERGRQWLIRVFERDGSCWNTEPWETLWALLALEWISSCDGRPIDDRTVCAFPWLLEQCRTDAPDRPVLVNWHYTALFLLVVHRYQQTTLVTLDGPLTDSLSRMKTQLEGALYAGLLKELTKARLWTPELWSNGLALWALAECGTIPITDELTSAIVGEFFELIADDAQTEDLAFASVALFKLHAYRSPDRIAGESSLKASLGADLAHELDYREHFRELPGGVYQFTIDRRWLVVPVVLALSLFIAAFTEQQGDGWRRWAGFAASGLVALTAVLEMFGIELRALLGLRSDKETL